MTNEKKKFLKSTLFPVIFVFLIIIIWIMGEHYQLKLYRYGIYPKESKGLWGILAAPFIHGDHKHLIANSIPLLVLGTGLFYFYRSIAHKVFFLSFFISNMMLWLGGRHVYHIGASGLIYAIAAFLFFSGIFRKDVRMASVSLIVVFLYGSLVWGLFPINPAISWEGHLYGAITGLVLSLFYKDYGPQRRKYSWEFEEDDEEEFPYWYTDFDDD